MLNLERMTFMREPYLVGLATQVFDEAAYDALTNAVPPLDECYSCSETSKGQTFRRRVFAFAPDQGERFHRLARSSPWLEWDRYVRGPAFIAQVRTLLTRQNVTLPERTYLRWTLILIDGAGGFLAPHTDAPQKLVTLVLPLRLGYWDPRWRGGTDLLAPLTDVDPARPGRFHDFRIVTTLQYGRNQCVLFVRSDASWHSVGPVAAPAGHVRRALIVNIEDRPRSC